MSLVELLLLLVCASLGIGMWLMMQQIKQSAASQAPLMEWLKQTSTIMQQSDKNVTDTLQKSYQELNQRLENTSRVINELKLETGKFSEIGRSMKVLQDFLNAPKLRGTIGERILTDLIAQVLPQEAYAVQYRFSSGDIVDAIIKTKGGIIPIDSKFPMENYSKLLAAESKVDQESFAKLFASDVKKHIKTIALKYIRTDEQTTDFALMYVPAEAVYYEITANQPELTHYAQNVRVLIVSPATFYAFLQTILVSFEGQRIAKEAQLILQNLRAIQQEASTFNQKLDTLSRHVTNAYNNMSSVNASFSTLQNKIDLTQSLGTGMENTPPVIE